MNYKKRSKEYDWFKGPQEEKNKNIKNFKTAWKFIKIFLMFSLFFFSMWGCVQVFIIKSDNYVARGTEFYQSESNIPPRLNKINAYKTTNNLYDLSVSETNEWISRKKNDNLEVIQKQITKGTGANGSNIKMSDAFKSSNEAYLITTDNQKITNSVSQNVNLKYLAFSSVSKKSTLVEEQTELSAQNYLTINFSVLEDGKTLSYRKNGRIGKFKLTNAQKVLNSTSNAAFWNRLAVLEVIDRKLRIDPKTRHLALSANRKDGDFNDDSGKYSFDKELLHNRAVNNLAKFFDFGIAPNTKKTEDNVDVQFSKEFHDGETNYRPIVTWEHAWVRGVGPFYGLFVYPISQLSVAVLNAFPLLDGWESLISIIIIVFILRIFGFLLTFKSVLQQTKQQELQAKKATIDAKYLNYKGNKQMEARQRQEVAELYKKEGISPLGAIGSIFMTMPIFLSIWRIIGGLPQLKSTVWLGISFSATSYRNLFAGELQYLPLIILAGFSAAFSQLFPRLLNKKRDGHRINVQQKEAMKKNNKTQNIILLVFIFMALIFSAGIQVYWIIGAIWQVIQTLLTHNIIIYQKKRNKRLKS